MKGKTMSADDAQRYAVRRARAGEEAAKLAQMVRLHEVGRLNWEDAQAQVGLTMSHANRSRRLQRWREEGIAGLMDRRHPPPSALTDEIRGFLVGQGKAQPDVSTESIRQSVNAQFGTKFATRTVQRVLHTGGVARPVKVLGAKPPQPAAQSADPMPGAAELARGKRTPLGGAGLAMVKVASELTGCASEMAQVIQQSARQLAAAHEPQPVDRSDRDERGRFLPEYNHVRARSDPQVGAVFDSVEQKRAHKDLTRLSIATTPLRILENKVLALMVLPVVSETGRFDGVTDPRGEWLQSLGAHDYMPETLAKCGRELKWAQLSSPLLSCHARLWYRELSPALGEDASALVAYLDSTTKPYWTEHFHKSGRVSTVGRVMPCLEEILFHTGAGVPLFLKTYAGHEGLTKNALPLIRKLEACIGVGMLARLTVLDGEGNSVALFKQFDEDVNPETGEIGRYFIVPLSHAQVKSPEVVKDLRYFVQYRDGDWLGSGHLELLDSKNRKAPPYRLRVLLLERRTKGTFSAYGTNAPPEEFPDAELMDTYFRRWPAQEHKFRQLKQALDYESIHGYGKRRVTNLVVVDELTRLQTQMTRTQARLEAARAEEVATAQAVHDAELTHRAALRREDSARHRQTVLHNEGKEHTAGHEHAREAEKLAHDDVEQAGLKLESRRHAHAAARSKSEALALRLQEKTARRDLLETRKQIYQTDVELDQTLSVFKLSFALLVQVLLHRFFGGLAIELNTFIREILALPGTRILTPTTELIELRANRRNPKLMAELEKACDRINALRHQRNRRTVLFRLSWPPGRGHHAL